MILNYLIVKKFSLPMYYFSSYFFDFFYKKHTPINMQVLHYWKNELALMYYEECFSLFAWVNVSKLYNFKLGYFHQDLGEENHKLNTVRILKRVSVSLLEA